MRMVNQDLKTAWSLGNKKINFYGDKNKVHVKWGAWRSLKDRSPAAAGTSCRDCCYWYWPVNMLPRLSYADPAPWWPATIMLVSINREMGRVVLRSLIIKILRKWLPTQHVEHVDTFTGWRSSWCSQVSTIVVLPLTRPHARPGSRGWPGVASAGTGGPGRRHPSVGWILFRSRCGAGRLGPGRLRWSGGTWGLAHAAASSCHQTLAWRPVSCHWTGGGIITVDSSRASSSSVHVLSARLETVIQSCWSSVLVRGGGAAHQTWAGLAYRLGQAVGAHDVLDIISVRVEECEGGGTEPDPAVVLGTESVTHRHGLTFHLDDLVKILFHVRLVFIVDELEARFSCKKDDLRNDS